MLNPLASYMLQLSVFIIFFSCQTKQKESMIESEKVVVKQSFKDKISEKNAEAYQLLDYSCLYCHGMEEVLNNAPSMQEIYTVYKKVYPLKQNFVNAFIAFSQPKFNVTFLMKSNGVQQCDVKQKDAEYAPEDIDEIAAYLFDYDFKLK